MEEETRDKGRPSTNHPVPKLQYGRQKKIRIADKREDKGRLPAHQPVSPATRMEASGDYDRKLGLAIESPAHLFRSLTPI